MNKFDTKLKNLKNAVSRLVEAIEEYKITESSAVRDGVIQRFEFSCELAWKTTREYLIDQGFKEVNSPKAVMREAFAYKIIDDEQGWISLLNDRNLTAHVYDETAAADIYTRIISNHVIILQKLICFFEDN